MSEQNRTIHISVVVDTANASAQMGAVKQAAVDAAQKTTQATKAANQDAQLNYLKSQKEISRIFQREAALRMRFTRTEADNAKKMWTEQASAAEKAAERQRKARQREADQMRAHRQVMTGLAAAYFTVNTARSAMRWAREGAQVDALNKSFAALGFTINDLKSVQQALGYSLDRETTQRMTNLAHSFGFSIKEVKKFGEIARAASIKTGQDIKWMFESIVSGTARQSRLILDNLGILIDLSEAYSKYAAKLGKTSDALTELEKKQAVTNEVMEKGNKIVSEIPVDKATEDIGRMTAAWNDFSAALKVAFMKRTMDFSAAWNIGNARYYTPEKGTRLQQQKALQEERKATMARLAAGELPVQLHPMRNPDEFDPDPRKQLRAHMQGVPLATDDNLTALGMTKEQYLTMLRGMGLNTRSSLTDNQRKALRDKLFSQMQQTYDRQQKAIAPVGDAQAANKAALAKANSRAQAISDFRQMDEKDQGRGYANLEGQMADEFLAAARKANLKATIERAIGASQPAANDGQVNGAPSKANTQAQAARNAAQANVLDATVPLPPVPLETKDQQLKDKIADVGAGIVAVRDKLSAYVVEAVDPVQLADEAIAEAEKAAGLARKANWGKPDPLLEADVRAAQGAKTALLRKLGRGQYEVTDIEREKKGPKGRAGKKPKAPVDVLPMPGDSLGGLVPDQFPGFYLWGDEPGMQGQFAMSSGAWKERAAQYLKDQEKLKEESRRNAMDLAEQQAKERDANLKKQKELDDAERLKLANRAQDYLRKTPTGDNAAYELAQRDNARYNMDKQDREAFDKKMYGEWQQAASFSQQVEAKLFGDADTEKIKAIGDAVHESITKPMEIASEATSDLVAGMSEAAAAAIIEGSNFQKAANLIFRSLAKRALGMSLFEGAAALGSLAIGDVTGAGLHGKAAVAYGVAAGVFAIGGALTGGLRKNWDEDDKKDKPRGVKTARTKEDGRGQQVISNTYYISYSGLSSDSDVRRSLFRLLNGGVGYDRLDSRLIMERG